MSSSILLVAVGVILLLNGVKALDSAGSSERRIAKFSARIVNGTRASSGQFPQQVSLRRRYTQNHFCGGIILTSEWILSAAHCMFDKNNNTLQPFSTLVVAGEIVIKNTNRAHAWRFVTKLIVHPGFDNATLENDVALLKLKAPLDFDDLVQPALITPRPVKARKICQVCGWGHQGPNKPYVSSYLMYVDVPKMSNQLCQELWENYTIPEGTFCAGYVEGGRDACTGDSGGGLLCDGFLTGVVSGGGKCAEPRTPGLYADVYFFVPWIKKHVPELNYTGTP